MRRKLHWKLQNIVERKLQNIDKYLQNIKDLINGKTFPVYILEDLILFGCQTDLQIHCNPYQNSNCFFAEIDKLILKFV